MGRYNIILIHTHDSGRLLSPYGYDIPTDNLKGFAADSVLFRKCFCAAPTCSPSRSAMLTGCSAHESGMIGLAHRGFSLAETGRHLSSYLRGNGYRTVLCGIQHETSGDARLLGYDDVLGCGEFDMASPYADMTAFDLDNAKALAAFLASPASREKPLFVSMGFYNTHRVFPADDGSVNPDYISVPSPLPDTPETREDMAGYHRSAKIFDDGFGIVMEALRNNGYLDDSVIVFTTDHGPAFPRMKCTLYDDGIGVALMIHYPGNPAAGHAIDAMVSHLDVYPTICDLAGIPIPEWAEGHSLVPVMEGKASSVNEEIYAEVSYHAAYQPMRCIRTERYKYIQHYYDFPRTVLANTDECQSKTLLLEHGLREKANIKEQLYDLIFDPHEQNNLADLPEFGLIKEQLKSKLHEWMIRTSDPFISSDYIPKPEGAKANKQTCEDPGVEDWE